MELTAQQIIDEHARRGIQLQLAGTETRVVLKTGSSGGVVPDWLYRQLVEHMDAVRARLAELAAEAENKPEYRQIPGTNAKIRVFPTDAAALAAVSTALLEARRQLDEVLAYFKWPLVESCNSRRNEALGQPNAGQLIATAVAAYEEAYAAYTWLAAIIESLRRHEAVVRERITGERLSRSGLMTVTDDMANTTGGVDSGTNSSSPRALAALNSPQLPAPREGKMSKSLGVFTNLRDLSEVEQQIVRLAWSGANSSADHHLCFKSDFPVGAGILAINDLGQSKMFCGCNVENAWLPPTICAERNAATTAALEGYKHFQIVSVLCRKYPGGSPCGLCRQVLVQFGRNAVLLNIVDHDSNVRKALVGDLLPAAKGTPVAYDDLSKTDQRLVTRLIQLKPRSHVPYSQSPRAALFIASNAQGKERIFDGVSDDNASYGASALAESVAMRTARTAGYGNNVKLIATVDDPTAVNPIEGECLQVLREFGADATILLVGPDKSVVTTTLDELLPDSFGPEAL